MKTVRISVLTAVIQAALVPAVWAEGSPIPASGDKFTEYAVIDNWTVYSDSETKSCLIERIDDAGNAMQMGVTKDREFAYLGIFIKGELPKRDGKEIVISIDGKLFDGKVQRVSSKKLADGYNGGYLLTDSPEFVMAIAEGKELIAFPESPIVFVVDLTGTKAAIDSARKCNAEISG